MNTTVDIDTRLLAAVQAAAGVLWSPQPLEPAEPLAAASAGADPAASAVPPSPRRSAARATAPCCWWSTRRWPRALQDSSIGALSLVDAARGVLEAAASTAGPVALGTVTQTDALEVLAEQPGLVVFPLTSAGTVHAAIALTRQRAGRGARRPASARRTTC